MKTENYIEKIPAVSKAVGIEVDELHQLFNGFELNGMKTKFEFIEMMQYFRLKPIQKGIIHIAMQMNVSTGALCSLFSNGFKVVNSKKVYTHSEMENISKYFEL